MQFDLNNYIGTLSVNSDDQELTQCEDWVNLTHHILDDPWLVRQGLFGMAGAMERQITYLGGTLLPSAEVKLNNLEGRGFLSESDVGSVKFANEDQPHVNDDVTVDQRVDDSKNFIDTLVVRMRTAAIMFVKCVRAHDDISYDLQQLTYDGIKAKAESNRQAREQAQNRQRPAELAQGIA